MPATLILAAGKGTRLGEVGRRRAKALIPIRGRPLLDLHLEHLARQGVRRVVVNAHHLSDQIVEHISRYHGPLQITTLVEPELLGTVIEAGLLDGFPRHTFLDFGEDVFPAALRAGHRLQAHRISLPVLDIGTTEDLARSETDAGGSPI